MPPKFNASDPETAAQIATFKAIGLNDTKSIEAARAPKQASILLSFIDRGDLKAKRDSGELDDKKLGLVAALCVACASPNSKVEEEGRLYGLNAILDGRLKSNEQVSAAAKFLETNPPPIDAKKFDAACGVGIELSADEVYSIFKSLVVSQKVEGWNALPSVTAAAKAATRLRWAAPLDVKNAGDRIFTELFGPKEVGKPKTKEPKKAAPAKQATSSSSEPSTSAAPPERTVFEEGWLSKLHKPGENPQVSPALRDAHLAATGGQVWTRFPPEPNGYLHIGHSKAIFVNFGYAAHHGGHCYLRYDDTNPEAEEARYFETILETVRWLGFEPWKITYSSDYFDELYELAIKLIQKDGAYVCHCTGEEINAHRGGESHAVRTACAHRSRPIEESLAEFKKMKDGEYKPGEAILRMKQDLEDGNPQMWDLIAYRILTTPHHRTGDKWRIYPTYDYTHCLVDSFENISHSLCTVEFVQSRQSYEWLCDAVEVYKPRQSEYGRLNLTGTVMSKRKLHKLVKEKYVYDWDDPRLYTLVALRRRGIPPQAIIQFVSKLGVSTALTTIEIPRFEQAVRSYLENTAPRLSMVLKPIKLVLENVPDDYIYMVEKQLHPKVPELGKVTVPFTKVLYIEQDDFRLEDSKDYFRLAPGKTVGLFGAPFPVTCTSYRTGPKTGEVVELTCTLEDGKTGTSAAVPKPKAYIHWLAEHGASGSPVRIDETRIFHQLFKSDNPAGLDNFLTDVNPDSLEIVQGALIEVAFWELAKKAWVEAKAESKARTEKALKDEMSAKPSASGAGSAGHDETPVPTADQLIGNEVVRFQALRVGYFALDKEATLGCLDEGVDVKPGARPGDRVILNRIVSLKEDAGKKA
ncbi:glutamine-tRNA ligase [Clavulina sp. PMI_390]|nr:glutamine-tRNA ligase [Clavulina sp. PMI_390]